MRGPQGVRAACAVATAAAVAVLSCSPSVAADGISRASPTPSASASPSPTPSPSPSATASPDRTGPSAADVARAREAAAAVAAEVEQLTARLERAEARLRALQVDVARAVTAHEQAQQQLADAEAAATLAGAELAAARAAHESADDAVAGEAALLYMQGGSLQNLAVLLLSPPNTMSDLAWVLDDGARRAQENLDAATAAESAATTREQELTAARIDREAAEAEARTTRDAVEARAGTASAEAARLGARQEKLTARLEVLQQGADDLATRRAAAAGADPSALLGVQDGALGAGPRAAQAIALAAMPDFGWDQDAEFACLVTLWHHESGWSWSATNASSGAYGITQALPGWKMASAGSDWLTNPATQIAWGMDYIRTTYGSPCDALAAFTKRSPHWY